MKNGLAILDSGPIFSLAVIDELEILDSLFDKVYIPTAVWKELTKDRTTMQYQRIADYFENKVIAITGFNELTFVMDYGESEALILYKELNADYLIIDDKKARALAENLGARCVGTIGILSVARDKGMIEKLRPLFVSFLSNGRYFSLKLLNAILKKHNEVEIEQ